MRATELRSLQEVRMEYGDEESTAQIAAESIVDRLRAAGYEAYFAGGCVRDLLLGREPRTST